MENFPTEIVSGAGFAIVVAGFLLKFFVDFARKQQEVITNHVAHSTEVLAQLVAAIDRLSDAIDRLTVRRE